MGPETLMGEGKATGLLWALFFSSPRPWHAVAAVLLVPAVLLVAARGVFVCSCCAEDCEVCVCVLLGVVGLRLRVLSG